LKKLLLEIKQPHLTQKMLQPYSPPIQDDDYSLQNSNLSFKKPPDQSIPVFRGGI